MEKIISDVFEILLLVAVIGAMVLVGPKLINDYNVNTQEHITEFQQEHFIPGEITVERDITGLTMRYENLFGSSDVDFVSTLDLLMEQ